MPFLLPINSHSPLSLSRCLLCVLEKQNELRHTKASEINSPSFLASKSRTRKLLDHAKGREMRPSPMEATTRAAAATAIHGILHLAPPPAACGPHGCWRRAAATSNSSVDLQTYLIVLVLCFLLCALTLTFAVRCFLPSQPPPPPRSSPPAGARGGAEQKPAGEGAMPALAAAALVVFSPEVELAGAEAECAICLTEFIGGEEIRVLKSCRHGFHDQCIEKWLSSKSSCPTCRSSCVVDCSEHANGTARCSENGGTTASLSHRATEQV